MTTITTPISFSDLRDYWKDADFNGSIASESDEEDPSDIGDPIKIGSNIKLSDFRGAVMSGTNVPSLGTATISINTYFKGKSFTSSGGGGGGGGSGSG